MEKEKILSLQVLKAFAFIGIMLSHTYIIDLGKWGVSIFFTLSGFLFVYHYYYKEIPLSLKSILSFSLKRILKLYPLYICTLIVFIPINDWTYDTFVTDIKNLFLHTFLLQSLIKEREIVVLYNGPAWYLSCIMFIYFFIPITLRLVKKYKNILTPIVVSIILFILQIFINSINPIYAYVFPLSRLIDVIIGCNLGYLYINRKNNITNKFLYTVFELLSIIFVIISEYLFLNVYEYYSIFIPSSVILVYVFAINKGYISKLLTNKIFTYLGYISLYGFLIHTPIIRYLVIILKHKLHIELNNFTLFIFSFMLTIICSEIWITIENFIKTKRGRGVF